MLLAALSASCGSIVSFTPVAVPSGFVAIPIKLLNANGPTGGAPPYLLAATSLANLEALVQGAHPRCPKPSCDFSRWNGFARDTSDVFLALPVQPGASITSIVAWREGANTVMIDYGGAATCAGAGCAASRRPMSLASIPQSRLPAGVVTLQLSNGFGRALVDLRQPSMSETAADVARDVGQAFAAAQARFAISGSVPLIEEVDVVRWRSVPPSCEPSQEVAPFSANGVAMVVALRSGSSGVLDDDLIVWAAGDLVDCGRVSGP
jgi:hypothetical protein